VPRNAIYDRSEKAYKAGSRFIPAFDPPTVDRLFGHALVADGLPAAAPLFEWVGPPIRNADPVVVRNVCETAAGSLAIKIFYHSMTHPTGRWRWIEPHCVAFDGQRWHVRAWCQLQTEFRDFSLGRVKKTAETLPATQLANEDAAWQRFLNVAIKPNRLLNADQKLLVADEYGMRNGKVAIRCREALLGYLFINLGLDRDLSPPRQLIELEDPRMLQLASLLLIPDATLHSEKTR
jgi:predicted DNA-binding transcriptional regulator YafY